MFCSPPFSHFLSLLGIPSVGPFLLHVLFMFLFMWGFFSNLTLSFWWQLYSILFCLTNVGMLLLFPVYFVPSQPAVLGCECSWKEPVAVPFVYSDLSLTFVPWSPECSLFLSTLYMSAAALHQPSNDCTAVFPFSLKLICVWRWFPNVLFCCIWFLLKLWFLPAFQFCASSYQAVLWYRKQQLIKCWQLGDNDNINSVGDVLHILSRGNCLSAVSIIILV